MRIQQLQLLRYGKWRDRTLHLDHGPQVVVIVGPNEGGKSTAARAIEAFLFGISPDKYRDAVGCTEAELRVGATLADSAGTAHGPWLRRKSRGGAGGGNTLRLADDSEAPQGAVGQMVRLLAGLTADSFHRRCSFDHEQLRKGSEALLDAGGDLGAVVAHVGAGIDLRRVRKSLVDKAELLFKEAGSSQAIARKLKEIAEAKKAGALTKILPKVWLDWQRQLAEFAANLPKLKLQAAAATAELRSIDNRTSGREAATRWRVLCEELTACANVADLPSDYRIADRRGAQQLAEHANRRRLEAATNRQNRAGELASRLPFDAALAAQLLDRASSIAGAKEGAGEARAKQASRGRISSVRNSALIKANAAAVRIAPGIDALRLPFSRPTELALGRVQALALKWQAMHDAPAALASDLHAAQAVLARAKRLRSELPATAGETEIALALTAVRQWLSAEAEANRSQQSAATARRDVLVQCQRLVVLPTAVVVAEADALIAAVDVLRLPPPTTAADHVARYAAADAACKEASANLARLSNELRELADRIRREQGDRPVPTAAELPAARAARDATWQLICVTWLDRTDLAPAATPADAFARAKASAQFSAELQAADGLADTLLRENKRIAVIQELLVRHGRAQEAVADADQGVVAAELQRSGAAQAWAAVTAAAGIMCDAPATLLEARVALTAVQARIGELRAGEARAAEHAAGVAAQEAVARAQVAQSGIAANADQTAEQLLALVQAGDSQARANAQNRARLTADVAAAETRVSELEGKHRAAEAALAEFAGDWTAAIAALDLPADADIAAATARQATLAELFGALDEYAKLGKEIEGIDHHLQQYEAQLQVLAAAVAADFAEVLAGADLADALDRHLAQAKAEANRQKSVADQLAILDDQIKQAETEEKQAQAVLARHAALFGVADAGLLPALEVAAENKAKLAQEISQLRRELALLAEGGDAAAFAEKVLADRPEELHMQRDGLQQLLADLDKQIADQQGEQGAVQAKMRAVQGDQQSADALTDASAPLGEIADMADEYARLVLAIQLLDGQVERFRRDNQNPLLPLAAGKFSRLTLGNYTGLTTTDVNGRQALVAEAGDAELGIAALSDGARDQLYLALRLAFAERELQQGAEPQPFILDDVLVHSDDGRAAAAFVLLGQLAQQTQVIYFTHHAHLVDVARVALAEQGMTLMALRVDGSVVG